MEFFFFQKLKSNFDIQKIVKVLPSCSRKAKFGKLEGVREYGIREKRLCEETTGGGGG